MTGYMFDTVIFNRLVEWEIDPADLPDRSYFVTTHQFDEIQKTPDSDKREKLNTVFKKVPLQELPTESFVLDVSKLGKANLGGGELYQSMIAELNKRNKKKKNNLIDILIAETAMMNNMTLVTEDRDLSSVVKTFHGIVCNLPDLLKLRE